ncbi:hypothetical protein GGF31_003781 [Allomyces arbusculus]|nr:hypothetical protein GGF31_003781 [Allomyces arbusculus]
MSALMILGVAADIQEIKELIVVFKSLYDSTKLAKREVPQLAHFLIKRSVSLCDGIEAAAKGKRDENLHPTIRAATLTLRDTMVRVNEVAIKANDANFINRLLFAKEYHDELKQAAENLTGAVTDLNLILRLDVSPDRIAAEVQRAVERDDAALLESFQQMLNTYHAELYRKMDLQHENVLEVLDAMHSRIKNMQSVQPTDRIENVMGNAYKHVATTIARNSMLRQKPTQYQAQIGALAVTSFDFVESQNGDLGTGSFGKVVRATWVVTGTVVAIKRIFRLQGYLNTNDDARDTVAREACMWSNLRHPHVLPLLGVSLTSDSPFFVMPLMENGDLSTYAKGRPQQHLRLLHETAQGMAYLHSRSVVHGDLKANNVLVDHGGRALVCDFGAGNVRWLAPERYKHGEKYQFEPDVFSFAMVMYELNADSGINTPASTTTTLAPSRPGLSIQRGSTLRIIYPYIPKCNDELAIVKGDIVRVDEVYADGWALGRLLNAAGTAVGKAGFFPLIFTERCHPNDDNASA